jgi:hypothetical protein
MVFERQSMATPTNDNNHGLLLAKGVSDVYHIFEKLLLYVFLVRPV